MEKTNDRIESSADFQGAFLDAIEKLGDADCSQKDYDHFVELCKKMTDADFLCKIIEKLLNWLPGKNREVCFIEMLTSLLEALFDLLNSKAYSDVYPAMLEKDSLYPIVLMLFGTKWLFRPEILTKFISNRFVQEPLTVEIILWGLLRKDCFSKKELKSNDDFCTLLRHFGKVTIENDRAQVHRFYKTMIQFLIKNYDWVLAKELVPLVLNISDHNEDFGCFFELFEGMESLKSEQIKILVQSGISFFAKAVSREKLYGFGSTEESEYESMLKYVKIIFKDDFYYDIAKQLIALDQFKSKDHEKIYNTNKKSILQRLIHDLKKDFYYNEIYIDLVRVQIENLKPLQDKGCPKLFWEQPDAVFGYDVGIEEFLESDKVRLVVSDDFENDLEIAHAWINDHAGQYLEDGYSFSAVARLSTEGHIWERKRDGYFKLMNELVDLETFLQCPKLMRLGTKRKYNLRQRERN
eukprot:TCONS_00000095-protein